MLFGKKKTIAPSFKYNPEKHRAIVRCSICTGEQAAGFKDRATGQFTEVMLIRDNKDLAAFKEIYNLSEVEKEY